MKSRPDRWLLVACGVVVGIALTVVVGWVANVPGLTILVPGGTPMVMNTALGLFLLGVGLMAQAGGYRIVAIGCGLPVVTLALLVLGQHLLDRSWGVDELFWKHQYHSPLFHPGGMAPNAALALAIAGGLLVYMPKGLRWHWVPAMLLGVMMAFAFLPMLSYVATFIISGGHDTYRGMAIPTAGALLLLGAAQLRSGRMAAGRGSLSLSYMAAAFGMLISIGVFTMQSNAAVIAANTAVVRTYEVRGGINHLIERVARMESSARAYALTGKESFRVRAFDHKKEISLQLEEVIKLVAENPDQLQRANQLRRLAEGKFKASAELMGIRDEQGATAAADYLLAVPVAQGSQLVQVADIMQAEEGLLLAMREKIRQEVERSTRVLQVLGSLLAFALLGVAVAAAKGEARARQAADDALLKVNHLQRAVLDGTDFGVIATEPDGLIREFNSGAERMLGYTREEMVGRQTPEIIHLKGEVVRRAVELSNYLGQTITPGFETFVAQARRGRVDEREWTYVRKDGSRLPVLLSITALRTPQGEISGYLGIAQDLSEKKHFQQALQVSNDRLVQVLRTADCLVWGATVTVKGGDWLWQMQVEPSGLYQRLTGDSIPDEAGLWGHFEIPESEEKNRRYRAAMENGDAGFEQEFRLRRQGQEYWIKESVRIEQTGDDVYRLVGVATDVTLSKRAESARDEIRSRLNKLGSMVPGMIYQFRLRPDGSSCFPFANEGIREIYQVAPEEVREDASKVFAILHPDDVAGMVKSNQISAQTLQPWHHEYRVRFADGTERSLLGNSKPELEPDGSVLWHGFITDISERRLAELTLRASEERFRSFAQLAPVGICQTDRKGRSLYVNERWCEIAGLNAADLMARNWAIAVHPEDRRTVLTAWSSLLQGNRESMVEFRFVHASGRVVWVAASAVALKESGGKVVGFLGAVTDITAARAAQAAMEQSEERFRNAFDFAGIGMAIVGLDGRWLKVNRVICAIVGYSEPELMQKTFQDITHPEDLAADLNHVRDLIEGRGHSYQMEKRYIHRAGHMVWVKLTVSIVRDPTGKPLQFISQIEDISERHRAEAALRDSEERMRLATAVAGIGVWDWDLASNQVSWDRQMRIIYGWSEAHAEIVSYGDWTSALSPEILAREEALLRRTIEAKGRSQREFVIRRRSDGTERIIQAAEMVVCDAKGRAVKVVGVNRDVTELRQSEIRLQASEQRIRDVFRSMAEGLVLHDSEGRIIECNESAEAILQLSRDQLLGRSEIDPHWQLLREDGAPYPAEQIPSNITRLTRQPQRGVILGVRRGDGVRSWLSVNTEPILDANGNLRSVVASFVDVTAQRAADKELRKLALIASKTSNSVVLTSAERRIMWVNDGFTRMTGYQSEEVLGKAPGVVLQGSQTDQATVAHMRACLQRGEGYEVEILNYHKDGTPIWVRSEVQPIRGREGGIEYYMAITLDITEHKQLEQRLALARDQALEGLKMKSQFLANMSHEIRTPMNGVLGMTELLMDTPLNPVQRQMGQVVQSSAQHLLRIIDDILDFSKAEAGKLKIAVDRFNLVQPIDQTLALLSVRAKERGLELTADLPPDLPTALCGDAGRIQQVLVNLVGNAIKFTEKGRVGVTVRPRPKNRVNHFSFRVEVRDTGIGITAEQQERLFQSFSQADGTTTRKYGGTGLGLAISRQLVLLMEGRIGAESVPGQGSVFWFELELPVAQETMPAPTPAKPSAPAINTGPTRILVAEDNTANQLVIGLMLDRLQVEFDLVKNGEEVLEKLAERDYAAILMDCQMPQMDGYETTRRIRAGSAGVRQSRIPILALTAHALASDRKKCLDAGMNDHASKPLNLEQLQSILFRYGVKMSPNSLQPAATEKKQPVAASVLDPVQLALLRKLPGRHHQKLLDDVVGLALVEMPNGLARLRQLLGEKNKVETAQLAHRLAGSAANLGAVALRSQLQQFERAVGSLHWEAAEQHQSKLDQQWYLVRDALQQIQTVEQS